MTPTTTANVDKLDQLHRRLSAEVLGLISGSDWQAMLAVASRFHRYSARNIFLIHAQRPDATRVAGFGRWRSLGRHVRRGEPGIAILAPCVYRAKAVKDADAADDVPAASVLRGFKVAYVFDPLSRELSRGTISALGSRLSMRVGQFSRCRRSGTGSGDTDRWPRCSPECRS